MILRHPTPTTLPLEQLLQRASSAAAAASSSLPTSITTTTLFKTTPAMHPHHRHLLKSLRQPPAAFFSTLLARPCRRTSSLFDPHPHPYPPHPRLPVPFPRPSFTRGLATPHPSHTAAHTPDADTVMTTLQELYATAKDEFEIAAEETEARTVYAADDRQAANEALDALRTAYQDAVRKSSPQVAREVTARVGARIRELENAVKAMEERALEG